jgi:hypothetical protein
MASDVQSIGVIRADDEERCCRSGKAYGHVTLSRKLPASRRQRAP